MLFHVTHTHGYETCMAHNEDGKAKFSQTIANAEESDIKVHGVYADPPGHQIFMVLETETMEQLVKFLNPIIDFGDYDIRPVLNFSTAMETLSGDLK